MDKSYRFFAGAFFPATFRAMDFRAVVFRATTLCAVLLAGRFFAALRAAFRAFFTVTAPRSGVSLISRV
jgi:hypothetical protein